MRFRIRTSHFKLNFDDLPIGQYFLDHEGYSAVKTEHDQYLRIFNFHKSEPIKLFINLTEKQKKIKAVAI